MIRCVLFDLDGTLVDTAPEIAAAVNDALARLQRPPVPDALVRGWIGDGTRTMLSRAFAHAGLSPAYLPQAWPGFQHDYFERCGTLGAPYPGVVKALAELSKMGIALGVVTNKEASFAHRVLVRHGLSEYFDVMVAGDTLPVKKPDPAMVRHALTALSAEARHTLFVGDSSTDVRTARAAGIPVWAVDSGYGYEALEGELAPDRFIDDFDAIVEAAREAIDERVSIT